MPLDLGYAARRFGGGSNLICSFIIVAGGIFLVLFEFARPNSYGGLWELRNQPFWFGTQIIVGIMMSLAALVCLGKIMQSPGSETGSTQEGSI